MAEMIFQTRARLAGWMVVKYGERKKHKNGKKQRKTPEPVYRGLCGV